MRVALHAVSLHTVGMVRLVVRLVVVALCRLTLLLLIAKVVVWQVTDHVLVVFLLARLPGILL